MNDDESRMHNSSQISVTIADLTKFHQLHLSNEVPNIKFDEDETIDDKSDTAVVEAVAHPSFHITDLVNDYYNLKPAQNVELTESQKAYLRFKEEHMRKFNEEYKPQSITTTSDDEDNGKEDAWEDLDY